MELCSPEEMLKGSSSLASSGPRIQYWEPISLADVREEKQRCVSQHTSASLSMCVGQRKFDVCCHWHNLFQGNVQDQVRVP